MGKLLIFITGFIITFNVSVSAIEHYNKSKSEYRFNQQLNVLLLKGTNYDTAIKTLQKKLKESQYPVSSQQIMKSKFGRKIEKTKKIFRTFYKNLREDLSANDPNDDFMNFMVGNG